MADNTVGTAVVKIEPDAKNFGNEAAGSIKGTLGKVAGVVGAAVAGREVIKFMGDAVNAASDLNESMGKSKVVFGQYATDITNWSKDSATAMGLSQQAAVEAAGTYGNLFVAMGIGQKPAADMSKSLVGLAGDLASFNNTSVDDALLALRSGLTGETEPLKRFGVNLNEATLKAQAMKMGLSDGKGVLDANAKAQAAYALIMAQTGTAQGDFARTSSGLANSQRILSATFENVKAKLGAALLPIITKVVQWIGQYLPKAIDWLTFFAGAIRAGFNGDFLDADGIVGFFVDVGAAIRAVVDWFQRNWPTIQAVAGTVLRAVGQVVGWIVTVVVPLLIQAVQGVVNWFSTNWPTIRAVVEAVVSWITGTAVPAIQTAAAAIVQAWQAVVSFVQEYWPIVRTIIETTISAVTTVIQTFITVIGAAWRLFGDDILNVLQGAFLGIKAIVQTVLAVIDGIISTFLAVIRGDWSGAWNAIKAMVSGILSAIQTAISGFIATIKGLLGGAWSAISAAAATGWAGFKSAIKKVIDEVVGLITDLPTRLLNLLSSFASMGTRLGEGFVNALKDAVGKLAGFGADIASGLVNAVKGAWNAFANKINSLIPNKIGWGPAAINLPDNPIPTFHTGGVVPGSGEQPAMLMGGEVVFTPDQMKALAAYGVGGERNGVKIEHAEFKDQVDVEAVSRVGSAMLASAGAVM